MLFGIDEIDLTCIVVMFGDANVLERINGSNRLIIAGALFWRVAINRESGISAATVCPSDADTLQEDQYSEYDSGNQSDQFELHLMSHFR